MRKAANSIAGCSATWLIVDDLRSSRGTVLHKLIEEVLTSELSLDRSALADRAALLIQQLVGVHPEGLELPDPSEMAGTVISALQLPEVATLVPFMCPELAVWGAQGDNLLSGRADAVIQVNGQLLGVVDWKSDMAPPPQQIARYQAQVDSYLRTTGAVAGAIVFLSLGQVIWHGDRARLEDAIRWR